MSLIQIPLLIALLIAIFLFFSSSVFRYGIKNVILGTILVLVGLGTITLLSRLWPELISWIQGIDFSGVTNSEYFNSKAISVALIIISMLFFILSRSNSFLWIKGMAVAVIVTWVGISLRNKGITLDLFVTRVIAPTGFTGFLAFSVIFGATINGLKKVGIIISVLAIVYAVASVSWIPAEFKMWNYVPYLFDLASNHISIDFSQILEILKTKY